MLVGYARVSTKYQNLDMQLDALKAAGCEEVFTDTASGAAKHRDGLEKCLEYVREGDTLVVWKIDRLGRSITHLVKLLDQLHSDGIEFRSLTESIDTNSPFGKALFTIIAALTQMERDLVIERTHAGLDAARKRGKKPGNKHIIVGKVEEAVLAWHRKGLTIPEIVAATKLNRATLYRYFRNRIETACDQGAHQAPGGSRPSAATAKKLTVKTPMTKKG